MSEYLWIVPAVSVAALVGYAIYAIRTRGLKGAAFGHKIAASNANGIEYRLGWAKHTLRIHRLEDDNLYGLEIGIWTTVLGETSHIVIPRSELLRLRDMISDFVEEGLRK